VRPDHALSRGLLPAFSTLPLPTMTYAAPNTPGSPVQFASRYQNYIGGEWIAPKRGQYFENVTPVTGRT
jgi:aldehyde dehydrogenase